MVCDLGMIAMMLLASGWIWLYCGRRQDARAEHLLRDWLAGLEADRKRRLRELREGLEAERWPVRGGPR